MECKDCGHVKIGSVTLLEQYKTGLNVSYKMLEHFLYIESAILSLEVIVIKIYFQRTNFVYKLLID